MEISTIHEQSIRWAVLYISLGDVHNVFNTWGFVHFDGRWFVGNRFGVSLAPIKVDPDPPAHRVDDILLAVDNRRKGKPVWKNLF